MLANISLLVWIGFAVLLAWAVGAYSRLHRLRNQVVRARNSMLKHVALYRGLCDPVPVSQLERRWSADPGAQLLLALHQAVDALEPTMAAWDRDAHNIQAAKSFGKALEVVQSCIDALVAAPEDLAGARWPQEERDRWLALVADVRLRRTRYNVQVEGLREAIEQTPASLIARVTGINACTEV